MEGKYSSTQDNNSTNSFPVQDFSLPPPNISSMSENKPERGQRKYNERRRSRSREKSRKRSRSRSRGSHRRSRSREYRSMSRTSHSSRYDRRDYNNSGRRSRSPYRSRNSERSSYRRSPPRTSSRQHSPQRSKTDESKQRLKEPRSERSKILEKWRMNYCETSEQIAKKLQELANDEEQVSWIRSSPADNYYNRVKDNVVEASPRLDALCKLFDEELLQRAKKIKDSLPPYKPPDRRRKIRVCKHKCE
jgi:ribonuclease-3